MTAPESQQADESSSAEISTSYAPYAQLAKMLVPSSGSISIYKPDGDLVWCSDGYEHPDLREIVEELRANAGRASNRGAVRKVATGATAFAAELLTEQDQPLGFVLIELAAGQAANSTMAASLLSPLLECIAARIGLEQALGRDDKSSAASDLDFVLGLNESERDGADGLQGLLQQCVANMGCISAVFTVPDQDLTVVAMPDTRAGAMQPQFLDRNQKHLLAWVQLNNRPMVVNRVGNEPGTAPYKILSCPVRDPQQRVAGLIALFRPAEGPNFELNDVRLLELMSRRAMSILTERHDPLTGLMTRPVFEQQIARHLETDGEQGRAVLLHIDIDRLQAVNDAFGLRAGDEVIQRLAHLIRRSLQKNALACRLAGDRFAVLLPAAGDTEAETLGRGLIDAMARLGYTQNGEAVPVTISIGIAKCDSSINDSRHLIALAELACRRAQQQGPNRMEIYMPHNEVSPRRESELFAAASLQQALKNSDFKLMAQPIWSLSAAPEEIVGYEVLVRMRDSSGTLVSPDKFMDAASRYALLPAVDRWVFAAAVREISSSGDACADLALGIAVNVSEQSLVSREYCESVLAEIERAGLPAGQFCFELSESAAINHVDAAERFIATVKAAGCRVALDRFGSGLASITHLRRLAVDHLKLDGALVRRAGEDRHVESLILGLVKSAKSLEIKTVAEHVESAALADQLRSAGVDFAQGFLYGQPKPLLRALKEDLAPRELRASQS